MTFRLYDAETGGNLLLADTRPSVTVDNEGLYNVEIEIPLTITFESPVWLGVEVESDGEMSPRYRLTSSPYAFWAMNSGKLEGNTIADLDLRFVNEGQVNSITSAMIVDGTILNEDISASANINPSKIEGTAWTSLNDGSGSGLDADMLDGKHADEFMGIDEDYGRKGVAADLYEGNLTLTERYVNEGQADAITSAMIKDLEVNTWDLAALSVSTPKIADVAVTNGKLAADAVTTDKIKNGEVQNADLADLSVSTSKLADGAVTSGKIADGTIVDADVSASANIQPSKIAGTAWTSLNDGPGSGLNADLLDDRHAGNASGDIPISNGALAVDLNADMVDGLHAGSIVDTSEDWGRKGVAANLFEGDSTLTERYVNNNEPNSITSGMITDGEVKTADLENLGVTNGKLAADAVTTDKIANGTIVDADVSASAAIDPSKIKDIAWTSGNDGAGSGLNADLLDDRHAGNASGDVPTSNAVLNTDLNADMVDGHHWADFEQSDWGRQNVTNNLYEGSQTLTERYVNEGQVDAIYGTMIRDGEVKTEDIADGTITGADIGADAVGSIHIRTDAVGSSEIASGAVGTDELAGNAVTSDKIRNGEIVDADISGSAGIAPSKIEGIAWTSLNDGSGTGLDADMLDGKHASDFMGTGEDYGRSGVAADLYEGTTTLTDKYVNEGQPNSITSPMIVDATILFADIGQNSAATGQVMKWNGSAWVAANDRTDDGDWMISGTDLYSAVPGNVGIGTPIPSEKLDVIGNIRASGTIKSGGSLTLDGSADRITASSGLISFDDENLVTTGKASIGLNCSNAGNYTFVAGSDNAASGNYSVVSGGQGDTASGSAATVSGGRLNMGSGVYAVIGGGSGNRAPVIYSTVGGGQNNQALGVRSTVAGGSANIAGDSSGAVSGGFTNTATRPYGTVGGGLRNLADGRGGTVAGGVADTVLGDYSAVGGGRLNKADSSYSTVAGGVYNSAIGYGAVVSGGWQNNATARGATVAGGTLNAASGLFSTVGGYSNRAGGSRSVIAGGSNNSAMGGASAILGGYGDTITATGDYSYLFGIQSKLTADSTFMVDMPHVRFGDEATGYEFPTADGSNGQMMITDGSGQLSWSSGGLSDGDWTISGSDMYSAVSGNVGIGTIAPSEKLEVNGNLRVSDKAAIGPGCTNTGTNAFVAGKDNTASGDWATVSGGYADSVGAMYGGVSSGWHSIAGDELADTAAYVGGGRDNRATSEYTTVGGGQANTASGLWGTVAGGYLNTASGYWATVGGGYDNTASGADATVGGGYDNTASGIVATVDGGAYNTASGAYATVGGGYADTASGDGPTVGGGWYNTASGDGATVGGGWYNTASGDHAAVGGGYNNIASGDYSTVSGGCVNTITSTGAYSYLFGIKSKLTADSTFMVDMPHIRFGKETGGYEFPTSDGSNGQALVTNGSGRVSWGSTGDSDWSLRMTDGADTTLQMGGRWGIARAGDNLYGTADSTHTNLGVGSTTGTSGQNYKYCTVSGGFANVAGNECATVGGGRYNKARGQYSAVVGGGGGAEVDSNSAIGDYSAICGGRRNSAKSSYTFVGGGYQNIASAGCANVGGGQQNIATGTYASVGGGYQNIANASYSFVGGGYQDSASGSYATVSGGYYNTAFGGSAMVGGGEYNDSRGHAATVGGGSYNLAGNQWATIGGGEYNVASGSCATVAGGEADTASGPDATIGGGWFNVATGQWATIAGGFGNRAIAEAAFVGGGGMNTVSKPYATVGGGYYNYASGSSSFAGGGVYNVASGDWSTVGGGGYNGATGVDAAIGGGSEDTASGQWATVAGGRHNVASADYSAIGGGYGGRASGAGSFIGGGYYHKAGGIESFIGSGERNVITSSGSYGAVLVGVSDTIDAWGSVVSGLRVKVRSGAVETFAFGNDFETSTPFAAVFYSQNSEFKIGVGVTNPTHHIDVDGGAYCNGTQWVDVSSRDAKTDIETLGPEQYQEILQKVAETDVVRYKYKDQKDDEVHIGVIAEDAPEEMVDPERKGIPTGDAIGFLLAALKAQQAQADAQREEIKALRAEIEKMKAGE
jgi:hypothetical protein